MDMGLSVTQRFLCEACRLAGTQDYFRWGDVGAALGYSDAQSEIAMRSLGKGLTCASVGIQSTACIGAVTSRGFSLAGQFTNAGTRMPPSNISPFPPRNGKFWLKPAVSDLSGAG